MDKRAEGAEYRLKAAHMRRLADQAHSELARAAYLGLEAGWLRLAQKTEEFSLMAPGIMTAVEQGELERRQA